MTRWGVTAASPTWYFAEGFTGGNATTAFETFLLLVNPGDNGNHRHGRVSARFGHADQPHRTRSPLVSASPIWVDQEGRTMDSRLIASAFGMRVTAPVPIVAERAMYWGTPSLHNATEPDGAWRDGHATAGIPTPATAWAFAEGQQGSFGSAASQSDTFFLLANPQSVPVAVQAIFVREDGSGIVSHRRASLPSLAPTSGPRSIPSCTGSASPLSSPPSTARDPACPAMANTPFVAERALYTGSDFQSGHVNVGTLWTGPIATPGTVLMYQSRSQRFTANVVSRGDAQTMYVHLHLRVVAQLVHGLAGAI